MDTQEKATRRSKHGTAQAYGRTQNHTLTSAAQAVESPQTPFPLSPPAGSTRTSARADAGSQKSPFYRPLPAAFRHDEYDYRQIARVGRGAIYEQSKGGKVRAYEVIRVRCREGFEVGGRKIEPAEAYPASEACGTDAWMVLTRERAFELLKEITG